MRRRAFLGGAVGLTAASLLGLATISFTSPAAADSGPSAVLWDRWLAHNPNATATIDHSAFDTFLDRYLVMGEDGVARVRYGAVTAQDRASFRTYITGLSMLPISTYNRDEQFAYWVNLYNAATIDMILDHHPLESIVDVPLGGFFSFGPWGAEILTVEGVEISLNDIEHRILRPIWKDPRIHYAVNCASIGCPNLAPKAFRPANMDALMTDGARAYVNHPRGVTVENGRVTVSSIYDWFESDFVNADGSVLDHIRKYARPELLAALEGIERVSDDDYDWSLNGIGDAASG